MTLEQHISEMNDRTSSRVSEMQKQGSLPEVRWAMVMLSLPFHFIKKYIVEGTWKQGYLGFTNAVLSVIDVLALHAKIWEGNLHKREEKR